MNRKELKELMDREGISRSALALDPDRADEQYVLAEPAFGVVDRRAPLRDGGRRRHVLVGDDDRMEFLRGWYSRQCDGEWERQHGVEIGTLDDPGWRLAVDVTGTDLEGAILERRVVERSDLDWLHAWCDGSQFHAAGGPNNLAEAVAAFRTFVESGPG